MAHLIYINIYLQESSSANNVTVFCTRRSLYWRILTLFLVVVHRVQMNVAILLLSTDLYATYIFVEAKNGCKRLLLVHHCGATVAKNYFCTYQFLSSNMKSEFCSSTNFHLIALFLVAVETVCNFFRSVFFAIKR